MSIAMYVSVAVIIAALSAATLRPGLSITRHQCPSSIIVRASIGVMIGSVPLVFVAAALAPGEAARTLGAAAMLTLIAGGACYVLTVSIRKHLDGYRMHPLPIAVITFLVAFFGGVGVAYVIAALGRQPVDDGPINSFEASNWASAGIGASGMFAVFVLAIGTFFVVRCLRRGRYNYPMMELLGQERAEIKRYLDRV